VLAANLVRKQASIRAEEKQKKKKKPLTKGAKLGLDRSRPTLRAGICCRPIPQSGTCSQATANNVVLLFNLVAYDLADRHVAESSPWCFYFRSLKLIKIDLVTELLLVSPSLRSKERNLLSFA